MILLIRALLLVMIGESLAGRGFAATGEAAVTRAQEFLASLESNQRSNVVYDFKDGTQRKRWSNLPVTAVKRGGLRIGDLSKSQRDAALGLLAAALSPGGYKKALEITQGDDRLKGGSGGRSMFGKDEYYISLLGEPSVTNAWMLQFGGHHLALNVTFAGKQATIAPSHTGAQPATYEFEGKTVRPLGGETDKAFALVNSLDETQRKKAVLGFEMRGLALGPGRDGQSIQPEGVKGAELTEKQRGMLVDLVSEWTGIMTADAAKAKLEDVKQHVTDTWFAWSGPTEKGKAAYFRIHGPTVFIEYAPQKLGGDPTQHLHTIYREPANDYGVKWWKE